MCQSVTNLTPARTKVNYFILSRGPFTKKIMDSYDAARQREALFPYTIRTKVCSSKFAYGSVFLWRKLKLTRASVSTVNFRRGALGFSVFGRIWWHLVLEQIIQTFFFVIWAIFNTFVTNRREFLVGDWKCSPRPYRPRKVHSFTFHFHISIVSKRKTFKVEQMKGRPIDLLKGKTNACTPRDCLGVSRPFVSDKSPKFIDREGLGRRRIGTRESFR